MNSDEQITLTGVAIQNETATVALNVRKFQEKGIDVMVSVKLLEYSFAVETFFFGTILRNFLKKRGTLFQREQSEQA